MPRNLAILIFDDVEVLDFCGPFEVFSVAANLHPDDVLNVYTVAETTKPISTRGGMVVVPKYAIGDCPPIDILLVPGGQGTRPLIRNENLLAWIKRVNNDAERMLSVCTGSLLYAKIGLLDGLVATTHHGALDLLRELAPKTTVDGTQRYVDNGRVVTSAGISAGIDMSLHVVAQLFGEEHAIKTARHMEYDWMP